jgi:hypothetical protein
MVKYEAKNSGSSLNATVKVDEVVCAHTFFKRKGAKPILQVTISLVACYILFVFYSISTHYLEPS